MQGSFTQAAFFYQNHIAALKLLDLLDFGSPVRTITLENYKKGPHIDDIIVETDSGTQYYQVKWSANDNTPYTVHNLISATEDEPRPLIRALADGYSSLIKKDNVEIILFSTRKASNQKRPSEGITKGLADFISRVQQPFIVDQTSETVSELEDFQEFADVTAKLESASGLKPEGFNRLLKALRFELNQPDKEAQREKLGFRLDALGIDGSSYETLLVAAVEWSISGETVRAADVLERLGLSDRFLDRITHDFKVEQEYFVENPDLFARLDNAITSLDGGFILLEGPPGSGKSTYLTEYKKHRTNVRFAYYCFVPNEIILGNPRLERDTFLKSLCVGIKNSFPAVDFPEPYSEDYQQKLPRWLDRLSQLGEKVVFVIDGLDHVDKKKDSLSQPLTNYLEGTLPPNVFFLLSSQYSEALAQGIQTQLSQDPRRHIKVERLSEGGTQLFLERRGLNPSLKIVSLARAKSEGLPVYLYYIAILIRDVGSNEYLQEQLLLDLPRLENDEIDTYHEFLYDQVAGDDLALGTLALLAVRREFTSTATLVDLLLLLNVQANVINVESICLRYKHLLRRSDARGYTIFHNSFREFVLTKTKALLDRINDALVDYYRANPSLDETYRNFYRHLFELGRYDEILADCDDKWLFRSWQAFRPFEEISANLDIAWDAATQSLSLAKFVRIAFLEQRFGRASFNFENTEGYAPTKFLLSINKPEEALRRVWDGETVRCSANEFYDFVLDYFEKTGSLLPQRIADVGFEHFERRTNVGETIARFQARGLYTNWRSLFSEAENLRWRGSDDTQLVNVASQEENAATNNSIKNHVTDVLFRSRDIGGLFAIAQDKSCHASVTNHALLLACEILVEANQADETAKYVSSLDFKLIGRADYNRLIIRLAEANLFDGVADQIPTHFSPPALFEGLIESSPDYRLKKPLLQLYDDLRVCFLVGSADDRVYQLKADSFNPPERNFFTAIVRLAKLWSNWIQTRVRDQDRFEELKGILSELNLDYESRTRYLKSTDRFNDTFIRREVHKIYAHIFDFAATKLSAPYISEIVRYWLLLDKERAGYKNQKTTINFAKSLQDDRSDTFRAEILALLKWAESQARADEETLELLTNLVECAEAYGYCGLGSEAERLWNELYTLACGVHSRKDYQFNEVIGALQNAHKYHPEKSRGRLITLLTLTHQLWGAADERAVARAIGGLIDFACDLSPALAIELLEKEEDSIYRGELIEALTDTLAGNPEIDLRYVWAIVRTMNKWDDFQSYNDDTYPTMLSLFQFCIERKDSTLAEEIYRYVRHQLLVEKEMWGRLGEFAELAVSKGALFSTVVADRSHYQTDWQEEQQRIARQSGGTLPPTSARPKKPSFEELHALAEKDFDRFEEKLAEGAKEHSRAVRAQDLKHSYTTLRDTLSRLITLRPPAQAEIVKKNRFTNIRHFVEFKRAVITARGESEFGFVALLRDLFELLVSKVCAPIFGDDWREYVADHFDGQEWLRKFASSMYFRTRSLESEIVGDNLLPLIEQSSIANLGNWEQFCRKHLFGSALTRPLLAIAERIKHINKKHSLELLIEAWTRNKDFFYTYGSEATNSFLALLFELDSERAKRTVLEGFSHQYKRFPQEIVYHLDQITEYAEFFGEDDIHEFIYSEYERYNFALVEGLTTKEKDFNWIDSYPLNSTFNTAVIRYLLHMFDYPPVETRKLSLASLFDLIKADPDGLNIAFSFWQEMSHNAKEHLLSLVYSLTLYDYKLALTHKQRLIHGLQIPHFNIRQTAKEILLYCLAEGGNIDDEELRKIEMINVAPQVLVPSIEEGALQEGTRFIPCSYQTRLLTELVSLNREDDFAAKVYTTLVRRGWTSGSWTENEGIVHRQHNFNTNFDNIEINGPYFTNVQEVLNEIFLKEITTQNYADRDIDRLKNELRLYDPADLLWESEAAQATVDWSGSGLSNDEFLEFRDAAGRFSDFLASNKDQVVLYEDGHQRTGDLNRTGKTTYFRIVAFLAKKSQLQGLNDSLQAGVLRLPYYVCHNRFRHELPTAFPESNSYPSSDLKPLLGISKNRFRGQKNLSIATLLPDLLEELQLSRPNPYSLTFSKDDDRVIEWKSWQRAYDQDRRRQQPKAAGVVMKIRKDLLDSYLNNIDYQLCFEVTLRRSVDQYVDESEMHWKRFTRVFW